MPRTPKLDKLCRMSVDEMQERYNGMQEVPVKTREAKIGAEFLHKFGQQLTADEVRHVKNGQKLNVVLTRLYYPHPRIIYAGPLKLFVQEHKGDACIITVQGFDWAEYDPRDTDLCDDGKLITEDYEMVLYHNGDQG